MRGADEEVQTLAPTPEANQNGASGENMSDKKSEENPGSCQDATGKEKLHEAETKEVAESPVVKVEVKEMDLKENGDTNEVKVHNEEAILKLKEDVDMEVKQAAAELKEEVAEVELKQAVAELKVVPEDAEVKQDGADFNEGEAEMKPTIAEPEEDLANKTDLELEKEAEVKDVDMDAKKEERALDAEAVLDEVVEEEMDQEDDELQSRSEAGSVSDESPPGSPLPPRDTDSPSEESRLRESFGIKVLNLPSYPIDSRLRSGLFHEFKRFGRITTVHVCTTSEERYGLVFFRLKEQQERALSSLKGRYFYGAQIEAVEWTEAEPESEEGRLLGKGINPYHYRANRSLFVSNLEKTTTSGDLRELFQRFGDIMKIEVKLVRGEPQYGFVTFSDIISVCNAIKEMDGHKLGSNRLKLGFGKSRPTNCLWLDGLHEEVTKEYLYHHFSRVGPVMEVVLDKVKHRALVLFLRTTSCVFALKKSKYWRPHGVRVMVDYSTQRGQLFFYNSMKESGQDIGDLNDVSGEESASDNIDDEKSAVIVAQSPVSAVSEMEVSEENSKEKAVSENKVEELPLESPDEEKEDKSLEPHKQVDGFHLRATRSLCIRNLSESKMRVRDLRGMFEKFGEIEDIDIKEVGGVPTYAFLQFSDITSVCNAINEMDGTSGMKLGFGKSRPSNCLWMDGLPKDIAKEYLKQHFSRYGTVLEVVLNRHKGKAMILFVEIEDAKQAARDVKKGKVAGKKVMVDFLNLKGQVTFYKVLESPETNLSQKASGEEAKGEESPAESTQSLSAPASPSEPKPEAEIEESEKYFAVKIESLPSRSTDSGVKDGLFHEFKKYGKIIEVQVHGTGEERYGYVLFQHQNSQEKALEASQGKELFGIQMSLSASSVKPVRKMSGDQLTGEPIDPYHPGATCSLCVRNLDSTARAGDLLKMFEEFGEILDVDIKKVNGIPTYAFLQFTDITSVCNAINEKDGTSGLKLGFGKSRPSNCLWVDGLPKDVAKEYLRQHFSRFGPVLEVVLNRHKGRVMILFVETEDAERAARETKKGKVAGRKVMVDFMNVKGQVEFYKALESPESDRPHKASGGDRADVEKSPAESTQSLSAPSSPVSPSEAKPEAESEESEKYFAVKIESLPSRSTDSGVRGGLFHEFKKFGKIIEVQVHGSGEERYGYVLFQYQESQEKALEALQGKELFGIQMNLSALSVKPVRRMSDQLAGEQLDPFHPGATCSLCIRNLESTTRAGDLRKLFEEFGEILDVDVIVVRGAAQYAILLFTDIISVCKAIKKMDGYSLGSNRLKLSFGRSKPTSCLWVDGLALDVTSKYLLKYFSRYGPVIEVVLDELQGRAMILFVETEDAIKALKETKYRRVGGRNVMCDFACHKVRMAFYHSMEASGQDIGHINTSLEDGREERRGTFREYSPDRRHYDPRGRPSYGDFRFKHRSRSRDFYPEIDLYAADHHGSRYSDDRPKYREHRRGSYENILEYGDGLRGQKRKRDWVEPFRGRDHIRRAIRRSYSPRSRPSVRSTI